RVGKSNARFDREKLLAFNGDAIAKLSSEDFAARWIEHLRKHHGEFMARFDETNLAQLAALYQPRSRTLEDPVNLGRFFAQDNAAIEYDPKAVQKVLLRNEGAGLAMLQSLIPKIKSCEPWDAATIHALIESHAAETGRGMGDVAQPLRVAVSGTSVSPPIHDTLAILGKDATLRRIELCLDKVKS